MADLENCRRRNLAPNGQDRHGRDRDVLQVTHTTSYPGCSTAQPPGYEYLGSRYVVWVEGTTDPGDREVALEVEFADAYTSGTYTVTVSKPDFAFIERPTITDQSTSSSGGNLMVEAKIRNSSGEGSDDDKSDVVVLCAYGGSVSYQEFEFSDLRSPGETELVGSGGQREVELQTVCPSSGFTHGDRVAAIVILEAARKCSREVGGVCILDAPQPSKRASLSPFFAWPFDANTLWHMQSSIVGGLQITGLSPPPGQTVPSPCTSSFALQLDAIKAGLSDTKAVSTTGHCSEAGVTWRQGSRSYSTSTPIAVELGQSEAVPNTTCPDDFPDDTTCRKGDQAYATGSSSTWVTERIFRPGTMNPSTRTTRQPDKIEYFSQDTSGDMFEIVGARPPREGKRLYKVGRTTGLTQSPLRGVYEPDSPDPDCPGNDSGIEDNEPDDEPFDYFECITSAGYPSAGGDSGSPVFVKVSISSTDNRVILVGVHYGGAGEWARFVPIDWIYAESLLRGYDWSPAALRPASRRRQRRSQRPR